MPGSTAEEVAVKRCWDPSKQVPSDASPPLVSAPAPSPSSASSTGEKTAVILATHKHKSLSEEERRVLSQRLGWGERSCWCHPVPAQKPPFIPAGLRKPFRVPDHAVGNGFGAWRGSHLALMRYCARLMFAGVPVMVIWRSDEPSVALAILICAPDICRISLILVPWRPMMQPIS